MKKRKTHILTITVHFDKDCTQEHALREVRDTIHGEFYPTQRDDSEPGSYRIRRIAPMPKAVRAQLPTRVLPDIS